MAVIHRTTVTPTKLELLTAWLPSRPWYRGGEGPPVLATGGGFRLDDPDGEVGIEFLVVTDISGSHPAAYLAPLTYRGAPLDGAGHALVGTMEHGVLGPRWAYDGCHDPVLVAQLLALIDGRAQAQDQNTSHTPDRDVTRSRLEGGPALTGPAGPPADDREGTELPAPHGTVLRLHRLLAPVPEEVPAAPPGVAGHVAASWREPDGTVLRGVFAELRTMGRAA